MTEPVKFQPHIRMLWSNKVDVLLEKPGQNNPDKIGSFTTYGKIMSFVLRIFFGVQFEQIQIGGRIHFVRPKEWERLRQSISSHGDTLKELLNAAIEQVKQTASSIVNTPSPTVETTAQQSEDPVTTPVPTPVATDQNQVIAPTPEPVNLVIKDPVITPIPTSVATDQNQIIAPTLAKIGTVAPLPQPPVQNKINILSLCPCEMTIKLSALETAALGKEFRAVHDPEKTAPAAVFFTAHTERITLSEMEGTLTAHNLSGTATAVVICEYIDDDTRSATPRFTPSRFDLPKMHHKIFHLIGTERGVNKCNWNDEQCKQIQQFLRHSVVGRA